jgi:vitamin B12 transporter
VARVEVEVYFRSLAALPCAALPLCALAQGVVSNSSDSNAVVVSASRIEEPVAATVASVTVVTRADIERLQPHSVLELLAGLPGISVASSGDLGKSSLTFVRGTNADHVLVLIDGIKIGSATTGQAALEQLPVAQIERIEIVRGPRSSLYGSDAIGGIIQIFTRHSAPGAPGQPSLELTGGSHDAWQAQGGYSGSSGPFWYNASASGLYTSGIPVCAADAPATAPCHTTDPRQGYWTASAAVSGGFQVSDSTRVSVDWLRTNGDTRYDGDVFSGNESHVVQQVAGIELQAAPLAPWAMSFTVGQSVDQSAQLFDGAADGFFDTRRETLSWLNDLRLATTQNLLVGMDYEQDTVGSGIDYAVSSRADTGAFGSYRLTPGPMDLELSVRHDHNQQFGDHTTGAAGAAWRLTSGLRLSASWGTAFKAPTFNDLYFPFYGNPTLRPETARSGEIGVEGDLATHAQWSVNAYETRIVDLIEYNPVTFAADNIGRARIRGVELHLTTDLAGTHAELYSTWLDPRDRGANSGFLLPRRPQASVRLDLDREFGALSAGTSLAVVGRRFEDPANTERLGGYTTLDLRAGWRFHPSWMLQARVSNALSRDYQTVLYYNQPRFGAYLTLRYTSRSI